MQNNPNSKRGLVDKNKTMIFAFVAIAAAISVAALMISKGLWSQTSHMGKVIAKKEVAVKQLEDNKQAVQALTATYETFDNQNPNFLGGSPDGSGPRDGSNGSLVLDALPNRYDFPALIASVEKILDGYTIRTIGGNDETLAQVEAVGGQPIEMPFTVDVQTSYDGFKQLIDAFDKSIRPFHIMKLELSGVNSLLTANIEGKSYYQPDIGIEITSEVIQ